MTDLHNPFRVSAADLGPGTLLPLDPESAGKIASALVGMDPWKRLGYGESGLLAYLTRTDPALARYRLMLGQTLAGMVCIRYPWLRGPSLELIGILDGFQGNGMGSAVLGWMEEGARGVCPNLWTTVSSFNHRAVAFYEKHGFREVVVLKDFLKQGEDEVLLRKQIAAPGLWAPSPSTSSRARGGKHQGREDAPGRKSSASQRPCARIPFTPSRSGGS
ncbi:MAG: GNAT family N-acetyltransferase [Thermodesulfobacteriota bacterium]